MIEIKNKADCCGCNACGDVCSRAAISFRKDEEGFSYPVVDHSLCISCGLCDTVCPMKSIETLRAANTRSQPSTWAAVSKNLEIRFDSTSGGLYTELAEYTLAKGGYIGGAVWDEGFAIHQLVTDSKTDLPRLRSSKYAQSNAQGFYLTVRNAVQTGRNVLLCGTPCQMAAVRSYLKKDYDNLLLIDFICRGINSPLVMEKYIGSLEKRAGARLVSFKQKCKELGWRRLTTKASFANGQVIYDPVEESPFMQGYLRTNLFCRPSCYSCRFKGFPRVADITLADCWGAVDGLPEQLDNDIGTSLVMCNTERGERAWNGAKVNAIFKELKLEDVIRGNPMLIRSLDSDDYDRTRFYQLVRHDDFNVVMGQVLRRKNAKLNPAWRRYARLARTLLRRARELFISPLLNLRVNGAGYFLPGRPVVYCYGNLVWDIRNGSHIEVRHDTKIGTSLIRGSNLEGRIQLRNNARLLVEGCEISYGCDIEIMRGAELKIGPEVYINIGATIICGKSIALGRGVTFGRNVTVRDTNGGHYVNSSDYQDAAPVVIEDHVWLCEGCRVMPGVRIGAGSVVAAGAVVTKDVPANVLVAGVPARVVKEHVSWKR